MKTYLMIIINTTLRQSAWEMSKWFMESNYDEHIFFPNYFIWDEVESTTNTIMQLVETCIQYE